MPAHSLSSNQFSLVSTVFDSITIQTDVYALPGFYPTSLEEKKKLIYNFFTNQKIVFSNWVPDSPFFNTTRMDSPLKGDVLYDIETILFHYFNKDQIFNFQIKTNALGMDCDFKTCKCVKIKIAPNSDRLLEIAELLNTKAKEEFFPLIRFDGNKKFEIDELMIFLDMLDDAVLERIEYIEEPFKNYYDSFSFIHYAPIKIAFDESLVYLLNDFKSLPKNSPLILKPGLFGISKSYEIIKEANKCSHSVIISSTYQTASSFLPLLSLANYADSLNTTASFHGLDTINYLPKTKQNNQLLNSLKYT